MDNGRSVQILVTTAPVRICILADQSAFTADTKQQLDDLGIALILKRPGTDATIFTLPAQPTESDAL